MIAVSRSTDGTRQAERAIIAEAFARFGTSTIGALSTEAGDVMVAAPPQWFLFSTFVAMAKTGSTLRVFTALRSRWSTCLRDASTPRTLSRLTSNILVAARVDVRLVITLAVVAEMLGGVTLIAVVTFLTNFNPATGGNGALNFRPFICRKNAS